MGIWFDRLLKKKEGKRQTESFSFIKKRISHSNVHIGLTDTPFNSEILYQNCTENPSFLFVIDGEIENLVELSIDLGLDSVDVAKVVTVLYEREGVEGIERIRGYVTMILHDILLDKTFIYRAFLNGNPLFFTTKNDRITFSTNPLHLLKRIDMMHEVDNEMMVHIFAVQPFIKPYTFFKDIQEVQHGELIIVSSEGLERKMIQLDSMLQNDFVYDDDQKVFERYRYLLEKAVNRSIKPHKKYGIMLSSGMDSASIAYFAAKKLHEEGRELTAYSWSLPGDPADESENIKLLCKELGIKLKMFNGENFGPFDDLDENFFFPGTPMINGFWKLNRECYRLAHEDGIDVLFNGNFADLLFLDRGSQWRSMIKDRRAELLLPFIITSIKQKGILRILKSIFNRLFYVKKIGCSYCTGNDTTPWLTDAARELTNKKKKDHQSKKLKHYEPMLSSVRASSVGIERFLSGMYGITRIEPHRDIELLAFSLGVPPYLNYRNGQKKFFAREAMRGLLPEEIRLQPRVGNLFNFMKMNFRKNREKVYTQILKGQSSWNFYIKEEWMREKLKEGADVDFKDLVVIGLCTRLRFWKESISYR